MSYVRWNLNEFTGTYCDKCGGRMLAVEGPKGWFAGCENYYSGGCRNAKPLPKSKPLLNATGEPVSSGPSEATHPVAQANQEEYLSRLSEDNLQKVDALLVWLDQQQYALFDQFKKMRQFLTTAQTQRVQSRRTGTRPRT